MTYLEARILFDKARNKARGKPIGNHLSVIKQNEVEYAIEHHNTSIVVILDDDSVVLHNGGWYSVTTKKHINSYLPSGAYLRQVNGEWRIHDAFDNVSAWYDGIRIGCDGVIVGNIKPLPPKPKRKKRSTNVPKAFVPEIPHDQAHTYTVFNASLPENVVSLADFKNRRKVA